MIGFSKKKLTYVKKKRSDWCK